ncbi:MAG TPA: HEAT repeat domain-containing protein [Acidobacteriota bacterium]|nr:HEAT repeat domain-containing protein [Acidobacteriota bacterium]
MHFVFNGSWLHYPAQASLLAVPATLFGIVILLASILLRRVIRNRFLRHRDLRTLRIRRDWDRIISREIPPETWLFHPIDGQVVEEILLDQMDVAGAAELIPLRQFARNSGLLDRRVRDVRHSKGWRRRHALLALGRMRIPEGVPAIVEVLSDRNMATVVDAVRGLGKIGTPQAAEPILELLESGDLSCPQQTLQIALANCFRGHASKLLKRIPECSDACRPLLARVLAEVANDETTGDLSVLASDPLAEVRACAARTLAAVRPPNACHSLMRLAADEEWFVRLRAVVALGELVNPDSLRMLVVALCDSNRLVRLRAAAALVRFEGEEGRIFQLTIQTRDRYALQALVSEMERSGRIPELVNALSDPERRPIVESALLAALQGGSARMLIDLWLHHSDRHIRARLARLLARSGDKGLLQQVEQFSLSIATRQQKRVLRWLIANLRKSSHAVTSEPVVAA